MGPQLYRCGNNCLSCRSWLSCPRFNGAATLSLRKPCKGEVLGRLLMDSASMGPQLYRCGNGNPALWDVHVIWLLQWGRNFIVAETSKIVCAGTHGVICFNGAATLSLRKLELPFLVPSVASVLQWGRNFIVAETRIVIRRRAPSSCFNGAATLSLRKHVETYQRPPPGMTDWLQWGRNFIVAETRAHTAHPRLIRSAAMLQWGRNFIVAETPHRGVQPGRWRRVAASMGPQLYRCGNLKDREFAGIRHTSPGRCCFNGAATLSLRKLNDVAVRTLL